ncbi:MAG: sugar ABC transporter permease [bacterium]|nr:sugar ABC transporter permease [bacterium]
MATLAATVTQRPDRAGKRQKINWTPYLFLLVPLAVYATWIIFPMLFSFYLSLTSWDGVSPIPSPDQLSLGNYDRLLGLPLNGANPPDRDFVTAFNNNVTWVIVFLTVPTTLGLGLAMIFNSNIRGARWFKISFYAPLILSFVVIGTIWMWIYEPRAGILNSVIVGASQALASVFPFITPLERGPGWLADRNLALASILGAAVWRQVGYVMILYLAGLKNLDPSLVEAAKVDGASPWQLFRKVIFPLLAPITTVVLVISVIDSLRSFDLVQVMTPLGGASNVLANFMYIEAFNNYQFGYGASIAVVLLSISLVIIIPYLYVSVRKELDY